MDLVRRAVKDQLYDILKERILSGEIGLGEKINILTLSKELNVSNTPLREALSMLERDGLVEFVQGAGCRVVPFSDELFFSVEQSVKSLITGSYLLAVDLGNEADLISMLEEKLNRQNEVYKTASAQDYAKISMEFDACFVYCTGNDHLRKMYKEMEGIFCLVVLYNQSYQDIERLPVIEEHRKILAAVKDGDQDKVLDLIRIHYDRMHRSEL